MSATPKTRWERHTGKLIGPRFDQNPWHNWKARSAKKAGAALDVPALHESQRKRELKAFAKVQASRPLKPPGKR